MAPPYREGTFLGHMTEQRNKDPTLRGVDIVLKAVSALRTCAQVSEHTPEEEEAELQGCGATLPVRARMPRAFLASVRITQNSGQCCPAGLSQLSLAA